MATTVTQQENIQINDLIGPRLRVIASRAPIVAAVGGVMSVAGLLISHQTFFQSYLFAFMFWFGITLGSTAWLMAHHVTGGGWGFVLRRLLEASARNWPLIILLWLPILLAAILSMHAPPHGADRGLYEWANGATVAADAVLSRKAGYLNIYAWTFRAIIFFAIWSTMGRLLNKWSRDEDTSDDPMTRHKLSLYSSWGLITFLLTVTFATIDWVMTLEPHWYSSLFGAIFLVGQGHSTLCIMVVLIQYLAGDTAIVQNLEKRYIRDIGNLMLAFTLLWAYTNFSQFLIQYSGNLSEDAGWFIHRTSFGWQYIGSINIFLHFALPFTFLLMSMMKVTLKNLAKLALFLLFARHFDLFWYIMPTFRETPFQGFPLTILADLGLPMFIGGLWLWRWSSEMLAANAPLIPIYDSRLEGNWPLKEATAHV